MSDPSDPTFLSGIELAYSTEGSSGSMIDELEAARRKKKAEQAGFFRATDRDADAMSAARTEVARKRHATKEDEAHETIAAAAEVEGSMVERSNQFDRWKHLLIDLASSASTKPTYYRQVLGILLEKSRKKDVVDFSSETLARMATATYYLRSESPSATNVEYILEVLRPHHDLALSVDDLSEEQMQELEAIEKRLRGG